MSESMPQEDPVAIAVFGATGAGKSSFLNALAGSNAHDVGHTLASETVNIKVTTAIVDGKRCALIDTPGFDDTERSNAEILLAMADFFEIAYLERRPISGILYLHRITDNRVGGTALRMLQMFEAMVGRDAMRSVTLVSTMWDVVGAEIGAQRETELTNSFWNEMIKSGAAVTRHDGSPSRAHDILKGVLNRAQPIVLHMQHELVDEGKALDQTAVGQALGTDINAALHCHRKELEQLRKELNATGSVAREALSSEVEDERRALQRRNQELALLNRARQSDVAERRRRIRAAQVNDDGDWWLVLGSLLAAMQAVARTVVTAVLGTHPRARNSLP